jgi:hypothetical protein
MTPEVITAIIAILTPFVVFGVTKLVTIYLPKLQGWGIVAIVVPIVGFLVTLVSNLITNAAPLWYIQLALGLLAVFINELYKQLKQALTPPTP